MQCGRILVSSKNTAKIISNIYPNVRLNINLEIGDSVNVTASKCDNEWLINNDQGLLVFEPDLLISTTSVVGKYAPMTLGVSQKTEKTIRLTIIAY